MRVIQKNKTAILLCSGIVLLFIFLSPSIFFVVTRAQSTTPPPLIKDLPTLKNKICDVFYWIFTGAIIISIIMTVVAAIKYMTGGWTITKKSGSDTVTSTRKDLWYIVIGLVVAILAKAVPAIVSAFIGGGSLTSC